MPGPLGTDSNSPTPDKGTLQLARNPALGPTGAQPTAAQETVLNLTSEERSLAAVAYAEGSIKNVFEEMAGIAAVVVRQAAARHQTVIQFLQSPVAPRFTHVLANGNPRHEALSRATDAEISNSAGMMTAVKAARHALAGKQDFSAGGYFWDGADIRGLLKGPGSFAAMIPSCSTLRSRLAQPARQRPSYRSQSQTVIRGHAHARPNPLNLTLNTLICRHVSDAA